MQEKQEHSEDEGAIRSIIDETKERIIRTEQEKGWNVFQPKVAISKATEVEIARVLCELSLRKMQVNQEKAKKDSLETNFLDNLMILITAKNREKKENIEKNPKENFITSINEMQDMLLRKNKEYGSAVFKSKTIFTQTTREEAIRIRLDDKINRLAWLLDHPGESAIVEDTEFDIAGYLILMLVARKKHNEGNSANTK